MNIDEIKKRKILLDTNILFNCGEEKFGIEARNVLALLVKNKNSLIISRITYYEILRYNLQEEEEKYFNRLLSDERITSVDISPDVLNNAIALSRLTHKRISGSKAVTEEKANLTCDMIIGGTVLAYEHTLLLTTNTKDFPKDEWKLIAEDKLIRKMSSNEGWSLSNLFLLQPQL